MNKTTSWGQLFNRQKKYRVLALITGLLAVFLLGFAWWKSLDPETPFPHHPVDFFLTGLMFICGMLSVFFFWITSGRAQELLETYLRELKDLLGGKIVLHPDGVRQRIHRLSVEPDYIGRSAWWENVDTVYRGYWEKDDHHLEITVHEPRYGWPFLEARLKVPRKGFPVMWLWFDPPFRMGFEYEGIYVDSREGLYRIRPYVELLWTWHSAYGLKNIRFDEGFLELRFNRLKVPPEVMKEILQKLHELPAE